MLNQKYTAYFLLTMAQFGWAGNVIFGRYLHTGIPPFGISFWRWFIALAALMLINWKTLPSFFKMVRRQFFPLFVLSVTGVIIASSFQYVALDYTSAINVGIILTLMPICISLCADLILKERTSVLQKVGMLIAFSGALFLISKGNFLNLIHFQFNFGDVILLVGVFMWGVYTALLKKFSVPCTPWELIQGISFISVILLAIILLVEGKQVMEMTFTHLNTSSIMAFLYLGLIAALLSLWGWNRGVAIIGPTDAGVFIYLLPIISSILAAVFLGEQLDARLHLVGGAIIFLGVFLVLRKKSLPKKTQAH